MFLSIVIYLYSYRIISENSEEIYAASLEQTRIELDGIVNTVFQMLDQIVINRNVQKLSFVQERPSPDDHWTIAQLVRDLANYPLIFPLADDSFVTLNETNTIVSTIGYIAQDLYCQLFYETEAYDPEDFRNLIKGPHRKQGVYPFGDYLLFLKTTPESTLSRNTITAAVAVKRSMFEERFINTIGSNGTVMYIADTNNGLDYFAPDVRPAAQDQYRSLVLESRVVNWKYVYLIPVNVQKEKARRIQFITLGGLIISSFLGVFFSLWMTRRNYDPVKKLMTYFRAPEKKEPVRENEFVWLEKQTGIFLRDYQDTRLAIRKYGVFTLLEKPFDPVAGKRDMERCRINLDGEWNLVIIFTIPCFSSENEMIIITTLQKVLNHIFEEITETHFRTETTDIGEYVSAIVNWSGDREGIIPLLEEAIENTQQEMEDFLHVPVFAALGEPRRGPEGIYYSNLEAKETVRFLGAKAGQSILHYRDIKHSGGSYRYTQEAEQKIINLIRAGDGDAACLLLRQVFTVNNFPQGLSGKMSRLLAYDILGTFIKGMEQGDGGPPEGRINEALKDFDLEKFPIGELPEALERTLVSICRANQKGMRNKGRRSLCEKVKEYIRSNFTNPDLNISLTGYHFGISPFYLSEIFKEETGLNLLEYINTLRIEAGKEFLEKGCDVTETAEKTGFRGSGAFIRVFKKLTGVTPGQYKKMT
jgi:AraC-like DNA-binding protein